MTLRILADENVPGPVVLALRRAGHDVRWIWEEMGGTGDRKVVEVAEADRRLILTFDRDFGELAMRGAVSPEIGIVLVRLPLPLRALGPAILANIASRQDWFGHIAVLEPGRIRMRRLDGRSPITPPRG